MKTESNPNMNNFLEAINELTKVYRPRIQKDVFMSRYLKLLCSDDPALFITHWIHDVAKHQHASVDLYDGETLVMELPPVYTSPMSAPGSAAVPSIVMLASAKSGIDPASGQHELMNLTDRAVIDMRSVQNVEAWRDVVLRIIGEVGDTAVDTTNTWLFTDSEIEEW